jgi:hypothetical protein
MGQLNQTTRNAEQSAGKASKAFSTLKSIGIAAFAGAAARSMARLGGSLVKAASDAEETLNKFNVTFQGINDEAEATAQALAENFGLAQTEARGLLADTGDLLTGFGFTRESALDLSTQVQELAVDLASFTNFSGGAEGASAALTKALLGERESVKSLGIAITEADINRLAEERGIVGELTRQQKAMLTLEIATRQSQNAIGDFARSQDSLANQQRALQGSLQDLREGLGNALLPVVTDLVAGIRNLVERFNETDDATKRMIVIAGGLVTAIAGVTAAAAALAVALAAVAANPIVLGIGAVAAGIGGIAVAVNSARAAGAEELFDTAASKLAEAADGGEDLTTAIKDVAAETGLSVDQVISLAEQQGFVTGEMRDQVDLLRQQAAVTGQVEKSAREIARENKMLRDFLGTAANSLGDMDDIAINFASNQGIALERVIEQASQLENLTDTQRQQLEDLRESVSETKDAAAAELERAAAASSYGQARERAAAAAEAEAEAAETAAEAEAEKTRQLEAQQRINDQYLAARAEVLRILESEKTEIEQIQSQIDYLNDHPWNPGVLEEDRLEAIRILKERIEELNEAAGEGNEEREAAAERAAEIEKEFSDRLFEQSATRIEQLQREADRRIAEAERVGAETQAIEEFYAGEIARIREEQRAEEAEAKAEAREEELERIQDYNDRIMQQERDRIAAINQASREAAEEQIRIAEEAARERERIERELQSIRQDILASTFDLLRTLVDRSIEDEAKAARVRKAISIAEATINTAESVSEFLSQGSIPLAIAAGVLGAIQIAAIAAQPIPQAQFGGSFVVPPGNNDDSGLLRVNSGEEVNVTPARGDGGGFPDRIVVSIGGAEFDARVAQAFNKGSAQIRRRGAVQVNR